jgi:hypothetical protein
MADAKSIARAILPIVLFGATALGLYNVFSDNSEVRAKAEAAACGKPGCTVRMTRMSRNPIGQSFTFQVDDKQGTADVDCKLSLFLLGDWSCAREGGPAPAAPGPNPAPSR